MLQFENTLKSSDINVTSQPAGTLNSILFDDNGEPRKQARQIMEKNIIIADIGFGTFDPYGVVNREKVLEESINNLGMKRVLEVASEYIYKEFNMDIKIPQMRKCMKDGYFKIVDIQQMTSKKSRLTVILSGLVKRSQHRLQQSCMKWQDIFRITISWL